MFEPSEADLEYIAEQIKQGYTSGIGENISWSIEFEDLSED